MEWFRSQSRRLIMRLSLSVQLIDDLTGLPVRGSSARVWIDGHKPPIKKEDGRNIFTDLPSDEYVLKAEGGIYARSETVCKVSDDRMENVTIRLLPNRLYPLPSDSIRVEGRAEPGAVIRVCSADKTSAFKLLSDVKKGADVIGIYNGSGVNLAGKLLRIMSSESTGEFFRIAGTGSGEKSEYLLDHALSFDYPKLGTAIVPASECVADVTGSFLLFLKNGADGNEILCDTVQNGKTTQKKAVLSGSKNVKLDLTE